MMQPTSYFTIGPYAVRYHPPIASSVFTRGYQEFPDPWGAYRSIDPVVTISFAASQVSKPTKSNPNGYRARQRKGSQARSG